MWRVHYLNQAIHIWACFTWEFDQIKCWNAFSAREPAQTSNKDLKHLILALLDDSDILDEEEIILIAFIHFNP